MTASVHDSAPHGGRRWLLIACLLPLAVSAAELPTPLESSLTADIQHAQRQLAAAESRIAREASALSEQIDRHQRSLVKLRADAVVARRVGDEQTLGLDALQQRIDRWRDQETYQKNLLIAFAEQRSAGTDVLQAVLRDIAAGRRLVDDALSDIEDALAPTFERTQAALPDGRVVDLDTLSLGPLRWYWHQDAGGLLSSNHQGSGQGSYDHTLPHAVMPFTSKHEAGLRRLQETGAANLAIDPSMYRVAQSQNDETAWQHIAKGGVWIVPILAFALFATAIGIGKFVQFARLPRVEPLDAVLSTGGSRANLQRLAARLRGPQQTLVQIAMQDASTERRDDALLAFLLEQRQHLERFLGALAVTATVSPLLGLLGTVSGMITTFSLMTLFGAGDPAAVSGGISEALVTTEMGLVVAIPALIMHALLTRKATAYNQRLEASAVELSKLEPERG